jgi:hypothetical protein
VEAIEEAAGLYRKLGLQADLAESLVAESQTYWAVAEAAETEKERIAWLRKALGSIEDAVERFRAARIVHYRILALSNAVRCHLQLAAFTHELDADRVLALCREGEPLCAAMEDQQRLAFFHQVREMLEGED